MKKRKFYTVLILVILVLSIIGLNSNANVADKIQASANAAAGPDRAANGADDQSNAVNGAQPIKVDAATKETAGNNQTPSQQPAPKPTPAAASTPKAQENQKTQNNQSKSLSGILKEKGITDPGPGLKIVIDKSEHTLTLLYNGTALKSYHVELGSGGSGDKEVQGDKKTPEGTFYVMNKQIMDPPDYYLGSRWLGVSYPNPGDATRGLDQGLIDKQTYNEIVDAFNSGNSPPQYTALGGEIGIHGGSVASFGSDWTWGCIGLKNSDIEDFYGYVRVGTPILIQK